MKNLTTKLAGLAALGMGGGLLYARAIEPQRLDVVEVPILIYDLPLEFDGYRIVQFSDIHIDGKTMTSEHLMDVVKVINAQQGDMVVFTGDFITGRVPIPMRDLIDPLSQLRAPDGVFAVMGNHDHRCAGDLMRLVILNSNMIDLNNAVCAIQRGDARLYMAGVDSMVSHKGRLDLVLEQLPDDAVTILLAHEPDFADVSAATGRFALQLSGHSHGGQVRLPLLTGLALPRYGRRYVSGVDQVEEMVIYTNRGIGTVGLPFRFNCPPEITVITLRSSALLGVKTPPKA